MQPPSITQNVVQFHHLLAYQKHVELVCGFYGPTHPKCKEVIQNNDDLYATFMLQFKKKSDTNINVK